MTETTEYEKQYRQIQQRHADALEKAQKLVKVHTPEADAEFWQQIQAAKNAKHDLWRLEQQHGAHR